MPDDEQSLFAQQMQGVRRIHVDQANVGKAKPNRTVQQMNRKNALQSSTEVVVVDRTRSRKFKNR